MPNRILLTRRRVRIAVGVDSPPNMEGNARIIGEESQGRKLLRPT
jgi:hypothetical protein